jgi:hypothetical protein
MTVLYVSLFVRFLNTLLYILQGQFKSEVKLKGNNSTLITVLYVLLLVGFLSYYFTFREDNLKVTFFKALQ